MKLTDGKILWRSQHFPQLIATDFMIEKFNQQFPKLRGKMKKEFERMELWLLANPHRVPRRRWGRFIMNWMKRAEQPRPTQRTKADRDERFYKHAGGDAISLDEFLGKIAIAARLTDEQGGKHATI